MQHLKSYEGLALSAAYRFVVLLYMNMHSSGVSYTGASTSLRRKALSRVPSRSIALMPNTVAAPTDNFNRNENNINFKVCSNVVASHLSQAEGLVARLLVQHGANAKQLHIMINCPLQFTQEAHLAEAAFACCDQLTSAIDFRQTAHLIRAEGLIARLLAQHDACAKMHGDANS